MEAPYTSSKCIQKNGLCVRRSEANFFRHPVQLWNNFAPEQDCSAPLLKVGRHVSDKFWKRSRPSLNTFVGAEIATKPLTITGCDLSPRFFCIDATLLCEFESDKI